MSSEFQHILGSEQIRDLSITTNLLADGSVIPQKIDINTDLTFNEFQALALRLENVSVLPSVGNPGRLVWDTIAQQVYVDTGSTFLALATGGISSTNFVIGEDLTSQVGGIIFTLANPPLLNKEMIYVNGLRQRRGIGNDYTISGSTITFSYIPEAGSEVLADYLK